MRHLTEFQTSFVRRGDPVSSGLSSSSDLICNSFFFFVYHVPQIVKCVREKFILFFASKLPAAEVEITC